MFKSCATVSEMRAYRRIGHGRPKAWKHKGLSLSQLPVRHAPLSQQRG